MHLEQETGYPAQLLISSEPSNRSEAKGQPATRTTSVSRRLIATKCCTVTTSEVVKGRPVVENSEYTDYDSGADLCRDDTWLITHGAPYHTA